MNFQRVQRKNRKAISPVLATVILIAITLIAAVAIAGFVFGLFGTFTSTARVQASVTSCSYAAGVETCNIVLTNSGNANTYPTASCSLTYKGATYGGATAPSGSANPVPSGSTLAVTCAVTTATSAGAGTQVTGSIIMGNGGNALFSAVATS